MNNNNNPLRDKIVGILGTILVGALVALVTVYMIDHSGLVP